MYRNLQCFGQNVVCLFTDHSNPTRGRGKCGIHWPSWAKVQVSLHCTHSTFLESGSQCHCIQQQQTLMTSTVSDNYWGKPNCIPGQYKDLSMDTGCFPTAASKNFIWTLWTSFFLKSHLPNHQWNHSDYRISLPANHLHFTQHRIQTTAKNTKTCKHQLPAVSFVQFCSRKTVKNHLKPGSVQLRSCLRKDLLNQEIIFKGYFFKSSPCAEVTVSSHSPVCPASSRLTRTFPSRVFKL